MRVYNNRLAGHIALFLFCLGSWPALGAPLQAVVLERQGDQVVINKGIEDGVAVGQTWQLSSDGRLVIEAIREHSASGKLEGDAAVGSIASLGSEAPRVAKKPDRQQQLASSRPSSETSLEQKKKKYRSAINARTESHGFATPSSGRTDTAFNTGMEAYSLYSLIDLTQSSGLDPTGAYSMNPFMLASMAAGMLQRNTMVNDMQEPNRVRVDVEATYWDDKLVDLQTEVAAAEQGLSVQDTLNKKVQNIVEKGVDRYVVLEVRLKNVGKTPAEIGPFKYHIFLMSNEDQPIGASRVDAVLDKTLQPGDEVRGMVYFPKIVAAGQTELKIAFEQMFGDRGTLTFSTK